MENDEKDPTVGFKIKKINPKKLHEQAKDYLFFQMYITSEFIYDNYGLEALKNYYIFNQEGFFNLKMSAFYKMIEGIIKKLPKSLKIKEGLKITVNELQFLEDPKNVKIIEILKDKAVFEINKCSLRKEFNKLAKKSNKLELIDKCCIWCIESTKFSEKYGFNYEIELTKKGCLNYLK
ncbi:MAG: hypothetical protein ACTSO9_08180 [Candidatus Helarchaeota archaeon]